jgi:hypothetical protein
MAKLCDGSPVFHNLDVLRDGCGYGQDLDWDGFPRPAA